MHSSRPWLRSLAARLVTAAFLLAGTPAVAQAADAGSPPFSELSAKKKKKRRKKAKRFEKKGKKAYKKGAYDDAIVAFELAYKQAPDPRFLFNIGRCHDKLGDLFKAMEFTERYAAEAQEGEEKEDAEEMVDMLRAKLVKTSGEITIRTDPPGATVSLTGKEQSYAGASPLRRWLLVGPWKAEVSHPGHVPQTKEFSVGLGQSSEVAVKLVSEEDIAKAKAEAEAEEAAKAKAEEAAKAKAEEDVAAAAVQPGPDARAETGAADAPAAPKAGLSTLTWIAAGVAVAAVGAGFALSSQVSDKLDERDALIAGRDVGGRTKAGALEDDAASLALMGNAAFATGGVALSAALLTWHFDL